MKSTELGVSKKSNYYIHSPSLLAKQTFLYPLFLGSFEYEKGYSIKRNAFDSYLIMYVKEGSISININQNIYTATKNHIVIIDCYQPHEYWANIESSVDWFHFDGIVAKNYFTLITKDKNYVLNLQDNFTFEINIKKLYNLFNENKFIKEAMLSKYITNILTELIIQQDTENTDTSVASKIEVAIIYINENSNKNITLEFLAEQVSLSPYYFSRIFKKETGFTPYQYVLYARINHAKFLLKNPELTIKEICFLCGFNCESNFCTSFKSWVNETPSNYRLNVIGKK